MKKENKIDVTAYFFYSTRYWTDENNLKRALESMKTEFMDVCSDIRFIDADKGLPDNEKGKVMVAVPMSGAVQPVVLQAAENYEAVCIYPGYVEDNFNEEARLGMLELNAAPAVMDIYGVLKREKEHVFLCENKKKLKAAIRAAKSYLKMQGSRIVLIGDTEPWVISSSRDFDVYKEKLGVEIINITLEELIRKYNKITDEEAKELYDTWKDGAYDIVEPDEKDIMNASRLIVTLLGVIEENNADGIAVACFDLLHRLNTTACLSLSHINSKTDYIAACEGDLDSAVTMLFMKQLTEARLWMANPNLQKDGTVNFVHCTAPTESNGVTYSYKLRNHHESGIGVSPQVDFPDGLRLTACRISDDASSITINTGTGEKGTREPTCRTQYKVKFDDYESYIKNVLGCHQVFVFDDISEEAALLADMLGLEILSG